LSCSLKKSAGGCGACGGAAGGGGSTEGSSDGSACSCSCSSSCFNGDNNSNSTNSTPSQKSRSVSSSPSSSSRKRNGGANVGGSNALSAPSDGRRPSSRWKLYHKDTHPHSGGLSSLAPSSGEMGPGSSTGTGSGSVGMSMSHTPTYTSFFGYFFRSHWSSSSFTSSVSKSQSVKKWMMNEMTSASFWALLALLCLMGSWLATCIGAV
jgi:hypothetical protein